MRVSITVVVVAVAAVLGLVAGASNVEAQDKDTLVIALDTLGAMVMDPIADTRAPHAHYHAPIWDSLVGFDLDKGGIGPGVAEKWERAADGKSWTFYLRKGLKFHNGDPVTAHDVKFSLERKMSPESIASGAAALRRAIDRIEVVDDHTVRVHTKGIIPHFAASLSRAVFMEGSVMPKKYIETVGVKGFREKPIGSGPWKFVRSVSGDRIEYEAVNTPHWRGTPQFKRLVLLLVPEQSTRLAMVRTGEASIVSIGPDAIKEAQAGGMKIVSVPGTMQAVYQFWGLYRPETKGSPVNDVRVREALSLAIDRQQIIEHVMGKQARWPMPFATFRYSSDVEVARWEDWSKSALRYDPARAKKLLADAGHAGGFKLTFWNTALPGTPFMVQIGEVVAGFWEKIGIKVEMKTVEWGVFDPMTRGEQKGLPGTASMYRTAGRPEPAPRYTTFTSKGVQHIFGDTKDCPALCQEVDKVYEAVVSEKDDAKRLAATTRMLEVVANSWMAVPIVEGVGLWAVNPKRVGQFKPIPGRHEFGDVAERMPRPEQRPWN
jgi:peptide/nickel transport system substrate-binding protein